MLNKTRFVTCAAQGALLILAASLGGFFVRAGTAALCHGRHDRISGFELHFSTPSEGFMEKRY
ncbi:hypothetical protein [Uliginosibacterium sp. TH139]|uniref:hypothetical protein n=1 Tax=Uliginosibacterium sp. TH139 TaxID=2067453 RepID=UPI00130402A6|nr:hypothetical protein [Uliginosibacterium sp. TH139]